MSAEKDTLNALYLAAVNAAHPSTCLPPFLPHPHAEGRMIILAGGKAAGSMAHVAEENRLLKKHGFDDGGAGAVPFLAAQSPAPL